MKPIKHITLSECEFNKALEEFVESKKAELATAAFQLTDVSTSHKINAFDRLTAQGYKLNLITGEYEK